MEFFLSWYILTCHIICFSSMWCFLKMEAVKVLLLSPQQQKVPSNLFWMASMVRKLQFTSPATNFPIPELWSFHSLKGSNLESHHFVLIFVRIKFFLIYNKLSLENIEPIFHFSTATNSFHISLNLRKKHKFIYKLTFIFTI